MRCRAAGQATATGVSGWLRVMRSTTPTIRAATSRSTAPRATRTASHPGSSASASIAAVRLRVEHAWVRSTKSRTLAAGSAQCRILISVCWRRSGAWAAMLLSAATAACPREASSVTTATRRSRGRSPAIRSTVATRRLAVDDTVRSAVSLLTTRPRWRRARSIVAPGFCAAPRASGPDIRGSSRAGAGRSALPPLWGVVDPGWRDQGPPSRTMDIGEHQAVERLRHPPSAASTATCTVGARGASQGPSSGGEALTRWRLAAQSP